MGFQFGGTDCGGIAHTLNAGKVFGQRLALYIVAELAASHMRIRVKKPRQAAQNLLIGGHAPFDVLDSLAHPEVEVDALALIG